MEPLLGEYWDSKALDCVPVPAQLFRSSLEPEPHGTGATVQTPLSFLAPVLLEEGLRAVLRSVSLVARTGTAPGLVGKIRMNPRVQIGAALGGCGLLYLQMAFP